MASLSRARSGSTTGVVDLDLSDERASQLLEDVSLDDVEEHMDTVQADLDALLSPPPTKTSMTNGIASPGATSSNPRSSTTSFAESEGVVDVDAGRFSNVPLSASSQGSERGSPRGFTSPPMRASGGGKKSGVLKELKLNGGARSPSPAQTHRAAGSNASLMSVARSPSPLNPSKSSTSVPASGTTGNKPPARLISHKKSASLASLTSLASSRTLASHDLANDKGRNRMSSGNLPFLLQRLEKSQLIGEGKDATKAKDEHLKMKEEFARIKSTGAPDRPTSIDLNDIDTLKGQANGVIDEQIDWGVHDISCAISQIKS
ncbi:hypothetical protein SCHPADRAFT_124601 [Schizopora paradoxa]|uniref:Uncharacterized protein n=1 Tax=Schizopora paradoxa TaxID=27342 RepID=A0A0H2S9R7_9AGAM|nr:hypothetical protein SCHPADRAFT_124601 [Schizopora paradoxa]